MDKIKIDDTVLVTDTAIGYASDYKNQIKIVSKCLDYFDNKKDYRYNLHKTNGCVFLSTEIKKVSLSKIEKLIYNVD